MKLQSLKKNLKEDLKNEFVYDKFKNRPISKKNKSFKLFNFFVFTNEKSFIWNDWSFKINHKFIINHDWYFIIEFKLIYIIFKLKKKALK